jgi:hypothetical protein
MMRDSTAAVTAAVGAYLWVKLFDTLVGQCRLTPA